MAIGAMLKHVKSLNEFRRKRHNSMNQRDEYTLTLGKGFVVLIAPSLSAILSRHDLELRLASNLRSSPSSSEYARLIKLLCGVCVLDDFPF